MKKIISLLLCFTLICGMPFTAFAASNTALALTLAEDLKELNLFFGVSENNNFDLERAPTRVEALVMLIRVLGAEKEALNGTWEHPFTDVPAWADKYVGYGYEKGLANGVGYTTFGTGRANAAMYLTFVLRSLGYTENEDNFTWDKPFELARTVGILSTDVDTANFLRGDVVLVSYAALNVKLKGDTKTLAEKLIEAGVFTKQVFDAYYDANTFTATNEELDAEGIYAKCSPAVFYIEISDASGKTVSAGSGFFISSDGIAVTNYHVIDGASSAKITLSDTNKTYNVKGVLNCSEEEDWAVIKIDGQNFPYIESGDKATIVGGAEIFAIGSPLGLQNTISQGIISNVSRTIEGTEYIQITAAISPGSSGGALINKYGEVIGITTGSIEEGQSINLAVSTTKVKYDKGASVLSLASLNKQSSSSGSGGTGGGGGTVSANDAFNTIYQIATRYATFDYGDYVGYTRKSSDRRESISLIYSYKYNEVFINYDFYSDSGARCNLFMLLDSNGTGVDTFTVSCYDRNADNPFFKGNGGIERATFTENTVPAIDEYESTQHIRVSDIYTYEKIAGYSTGLAIRHLDDILKDFTNNRIGVYQLGYISF